MNTKTKILIVEHDADDIILIRHELDKGDIKYVAEVVQTEKDLIEALTTFIPDIILADYSLPSFSGAAAFEIKQKLAPHTPFIFVSGTIGEEAAVELIKSGVTDYVLKDKLFALNPKVIRALRDAKEEKEKILTNEKLLKANRLYGFISQVNQNIVRVKDEETLFRNSCKLALTYGKFKMAWIGMFDKLAKNITLIEQSGLPENSLKLFNNMAILKFDPQFYVLKNNTHYVCNDVEHEAELENWNPFLEKGSICSCLIIPIRKSGNTIGTFNLYSGEKNYFDKDEIALLVEVTSDISFALDLFEKEIIQKEAEQKIEKNEKQVKFDKSNLTALINNTQDLMWSVDRNFNLITSNRLFDEMSKMNFGHVLEKGENILSVSFTPEMHAHFKELYEKAFAGEAFVEIDHFEFPVEIWSEISYSPIRRDDRIVGAACHSRDITERKKSERNLEKSEEKLKEAQAIGHLGNWEIDLVSGINTWSDELYTIYGVQRNEVEPSAELYLSFMHPEDLDAAKKDVEEGMRTLKNSSGSFRFIRKDGSIRYGTSESRFDFDVNGKPIRLFGILQDVTELKKTENELNNTLISLESRVVLRTKELFEKNKDIVDSINYAKRIQVGLLSSNTKLLQIFPKSFVFSIPRDVVSGDFFWCFQRNNKKFIVVADCTGHGVPGALMSIIGNNLLNTIIVNEHIENPSEILEQLDIRLKQAIRGDEEEVRDGMDIGLCIIDSYFNDLYFASANRPVFISDTNKKIVELKPDHATVGGGMEEGAKKFETKRLPITPGQKIYLSSDGYVSQFGGPKGKKFMKKRFVETLEKFQDKTMDEQKETLQNTLNEWMADNEQVDDIMVVGIEL